MKKKGFTLIELLAVLVVLAILALITIPITIKMIKNAKENSYKRSIATYGRATENYLGRYLTEHDVDYKTIKLSDIEDEIEYSGNDVTCNSLSFQDNGNVVLRGCYVNNSKVYKYIDRNVVEDKYEVGDLITVNGIDFYVIAESGADKNYVTAITRSPLSNDDLRQYGAAGWANGMGQVTFRGFGYNSSLVRTVVDNWKDAQFETGELQEVDTYEARLITKEELEKLGYEREGTGEYDINYLLTDKVPKYIYDLSDMYSINSSACIWTINTRETSSGHGEIYCIKVDGSVIGADMFYYGGGIIRPVVNIKKDKIDS